MFRVELNKKYYAFDKGELYQGRQLFGNNTFSVNSKLLEIYDVSANNDGALVIFVNASPVLVDVDNYNDKINQSRYSMDFDLLRTIPISSDEYSALEVFSECQNQNDVGDEKVHDEIKKYIKGM